MGDVCERRNPESPRRRPADRHGAWDL